MKKVLLISSLFLLGSCKKTEPIEKYKGKGIIIIEEPQRYYYDNIKSVECKNKDSVFNILITDFDAKNLKVGDTL
jgi:hypothetical protein